MRPKTKDFVFIKLNLHTSIELLFSFLSKVHKQWRYDGLIPNLHTSSGGMTVFAGMVTYPVNVARRCREALKMHGMHEHMHT